MSVRSSLSKGKTHVLTSVQFKLSAAQLRKSTFTPLGTSKVFRSGSV